MHLSKLAVMLALASLACAQTRVRGGVVVNGGVRIGNALGTGAVAPPSLEDNTYCGTGNIWTGGLSDATALLPTRCYNTAIANTPAPLGQLQATITNASMPTPMAAFKTELANAVCGEIIYLAPGAFLMSATALDLTFPAKACDDAHYIWIASTAINSAWPVFPPVGQRITPCFAGVSVASAGVPQWPIDNGCVNQVATISTTSAQASTITFATDANHYRFMGIRFTRPAGAFGYSLVSVSRDPSGNDTYIVNGNLASSAVAVGSGVNISGVADQTFNVNQTVTAITLPSTFKTVQAGKPSGGSTGGLMANVADISVLITFIKDSNFGQHQIIFDRTLCQGTPDTETAGCLQLGDSDHVGVIDSWFDEMHCYDRAGVCVDSKTIFGGLGSNPLQGAYKIVNNYLEASGESTFFGGGLASAIPRDIEIRRNWCFKPAVWNPRDLANYNGGGPPPTGNAEFNVKNGGELKNGIRVLYEGNVITRSFITSDQRGDGFVLSPKNQNGLCSVCAVTDVTRRYERVTFVGRPFQLADALSDSGAQATAGNSYSIHDLVVDDIGNPMIGTALVPQMFLISGTAQFNLSKVTLNHLTLVSDRTSELMTLGGPPSTWTAGKAVKVGDPIVPTVYTDPPTVFVSQTNGTTNATTQPTWPARLSGLTVTDNGITWREDSANLCLYLMCQMTVKNSILSSTGGDGVHTTGGGNTNCINETAGVGNPTPVQKFDACWSPGYVFSPNVIYGGIALTWPAGNLTPANGNAVGFVAYNSGAGGDYRLCTGVGVPDPACLAGSPYAANGANHADDGLDMGADIGAISTKTSGVDVFQ